MKLFLIHLLLVLLSVAEVVTLLMIHMVQLGSKLNLKIMNTNVCIGGK